jgi:cardiolipin synthase C
MPHGVFSSRRFLVLFVFILLLPLPGFASRPGNFPDNPGLAKVFQDIPGGAVARIRMIRQNDQAWYARWHLIESARESIDATYFILSNDVFGLSFLGLLKRKAEQGVKIRLMIDARMIRTYFRPIGIDEFQDLVQHSNVQIKFYNSIPNSLKTFLSERDLKMLTVSNHDKILIADGRLSITGGRNIGADYFVRPGEHKIVYHDSDVVLEGPELARDLKKAFDDEWNQIGNRQIKTNLLNLADQRWKLELARRSMQAYMDGGRFLNPATPTIPEKYRTLLEKSNEELKRYKDISAYAGFNLWRGERARPVKILDKHSLLGHKDEIGFNLARFIDAARHEIVFENPYVILTKDAWSRLARASARGVRIVLHTNGPKSIDVPEALAFFVKEWADMMRDIPSMRIFMAPSALHQLHAKNIVIDGQLAIVGTYNLDPLSMVTNSEVVAAVHNREFATMVRLRILEATKIAVACEIRREADGTVTRVRGPEHDSSPQALKKMNLLMKINWLRPLL